MSTMAVPRIRIRSLLSCLSRVSSLTLIAEVVLCDLGAHCSRLASGLAVVGEMRDRQYECARADGSMSPLAALRRFAESPQEPGTVTLVPQLMAHADLISRIEARMRSSFVWISFMESTKTKNLGVDRSRGIGA